MTIYGGNLGSSGGLTDFSSLFDIGGVSGGGGGNNFLQALSGGSGGGLSDAGFSGSGFGGFLGDGGDPLSALPGGGSAVGGFDFGNFLLGGEGESGQLGNILKVLGGFGQGYLANKQLDEAKRQSKQQQANFNKQFQAQGRLSNTALNNRYISSNNARGADAVGPNPFGTLEEYKARTNIRGIDA